MPFSASRQAVMAPPNPLPITMASNVGSFVDLHFVVQVWSFAPPRYHSLPEESMPTHEHRSG